MAEVPRPHTRRDLEPRVQVMVDEAPTMTPDDRVRDRAGPDERPKRELREPEVRGGGGGVEDTAGWFDAYQRRRARLALQLVDA